MTPWMLQLSFLSIQKFFEPWIDYLTQFAREMSLGCWVSAQAGMIASGRGELLSNRSQEETHNSIMIFNLPITQPLAIVTQSNTSGDIDTFAKRVVTDGTSFAHFSRAHICRGLELSSLFMTAYLPDNCSSSCSVFRILRMISFTIAFRVSPARRQAARLLRVARPGVGWVRARRATCVFGVARAGVR